MSFPVTLPPDDDKYLNNVIVNGLNYLKWSPNCDSLNVRAYRGYIPFRLDPARGGEITVPDVARKEQVAHVKRELARLGYIVRPEVAEQAALL